MHLGTEIDGLASTTTSPSCWVGMITISSEAMVIRESQNPAIRNG